MPEQKFLTDLKVTGTVDLNNLKINTGQGTDGQVLTSTGTGVAWEDAAGGNSETAERIEVTVKNVSGGSLSKGTVVHTAPSQPPATPPNGNVIEVIAADYDDITKMPAIGILNETIANEAEGSAVMTGALSGINTSSFSVGDELYVGNLGTLTNSKPTTAGQLIQKIAVVIKSHASNGLIKIFGAGRSNDVPLPLYIDNTNQRVGIGEPNPDYELHVDGQIHSKSSTFPVYFLQRETSITGDGTFTTTGGIASGFHLRTNSSGTIQDGFGGGVVFSLTDSGTASNTAARIYARRDGGNTAGALQFWGGLDGDTILTTMRASGKVGIGTPNPAEKLEVSGGAIKVTNTGGAQLILRGDSNNSGDSGDVDGIIDFLHDTGAYGYRLNTENYSGSNAFHIQDYQDSQYLSRIYIDQVGKVGIGTTNPVDKFQIDAANSQLRLRDTDDGSYTQFSSSGNKLAIRQGSTSADHIWLTSTGDVGIGTSGPSQKLEVNGTAKADKFVSLVNASNSGLTRDWAIIGTGDRGAGLQVNDISGAKYAIYAGGYDLTFGKHVSSSDTYTAALGIYATGPTDSSPYVQATHSLRAPIFYDSTNPGYYVDPDSSSVAININGKIYQAKEDYDIDASHANAIYQATRSSQTDRGSWPGTYYYGVNFGDRTKGIQLAAPYSSANNLYFRSGTDNSSSDNGANAWKNWKQLYHTDYHPEADKWTTARTVTLAGDLSGSVSIDGSANVTLTATVNDDSHDLTWANIDGETANSVNGWGGLRHQTNDGYIDFGPANANHAHIYTDRPNFYFNKELLVNNQQVFHTGNDGSGSGLDADLVDGYQAERFFRRTNKANATVGPGWMTVAENVSGRVAGEIVVTDADSGDHAYIRIEWMRSYADSNFTVLNCGGHANRITGARVLYNTSDSTYGGKKLQVYVTTSSNYEVNIYEQGDIDDYTGHTVVTPVIQNSISGYALHGNELTGLDAYGFAAEEGILSGGDLKVLGTKLTVMGNQTFGIPGSGSNTSGRWLSFEGNADSGGEGSGRLFFSEHNSSTTDMDDYGMSIGYRGGSASVTTAGGNSWTGLTQIGNGQWGMWGHDNSLSGALIMYGDRNATFVNFAGNAINNTGDITLGTLSGTAAARLFLTGTTANKQAKIHCTNGNLHIDSEDGYAIHLNYYEGTTDNVIIGNGNGGSSGTILKSTGTVNVGEHLIAANNVYAGGNAGFVFGSSTSEGEYIARSGDTITFYSGGAIKFDITPSNGVHFRNGSVYHAQISNSGHGRFANDVVAFYNFSDKRLKTNIKPTTGNLDKILKLNPVEYNWKEGYRKDKKEIGLIAQEVEKIIPEVVRENERLNDDTLYKQVDYEHIVSTLIGAVQEQQKQIDELKSIINGSP